MADQVVCDDILSQLREHGPITVASESEFSEVAGVNVAWSKSEVKQALGSLIDRRMVRRHRPRPEGATDPGQPITFSYICG